MNDSIGLYLNDIGMLKKSCSPAIAHAVELAAHTGLREGDIVRLTWKHVGDDAIRIATGKSRHRKVAIIPLYDDLRSVLAAIPRVSPSVLTDQRGRPWSANGLSKAPRTTDAASTAALPTKM